jgi:hypothetical protein
MKEVRVILAYFLCFEKIKLTLMIKIMRSPCCVSVNLPSRLLNRNTFQQRTSSILPTSIMLFCDRRSVGQSVLASGPDFYYCRTFAVFILRGRPPWREDGSVIYSYNCCHSSVQVPQNSWPQLTVSFGTICYCLIRDSAQPRGPGPCIYIPQE